MTLKKWFWVNDLSHNWCFRITFFMVALLLSTTSQQANAQTLIEERADIRPIAGWVVDSFSEATIYDSYEAACVATPNGFLYFGICFDHPNLDLAVEPDTVCEAGYGKLEPVVYNTYGFLDILESQQAQCVRSDRAVVPECNTCKEGNSPISAVPVPRVGNPISIDTGTKVQQQTDYSTADGLFVVRRAYRSRDPNLNVDPSLRSNGEFGEKWSGILPGILVAEQSLSLVTYVTDDGTSLRFSAKDNLEFTVPDNNFSTQDQTRLTLSFVDQAPASRSEFVESGASAAADSEEVKLSYANGDYITFRRSSSFDQSTGKRILVPVVKQMASGYRMTFHYPDLGRYPNRISDSFGREMALIWSTETRPVVTQVTLPDTTKLIYSYSEPTPGVRRLASVLRQDVQAVTLWGRLYHFEDARFPTAMTGFSDHLGGRLSTYAYDANGRARLTEGAEGVDRVQVAYYEDSIDKSRLVRKVTNPLGLEEIYEFSRDPFNRNNMPATLTSKKVSPTATVAASETIVSSENGLMRGTTDPNGNESQQNNGVGQRPETMSDAVGNFIALEWHPTLDLVTREIRYGTGILKDYIYNGTGLLVEESASDILELIRTEEPFSTIPEEVKRKSSYTWSDSGRLLSVNGPRKVNAVGQDDITSFTYDAAGHRLTMTDPLNHVTTYSAYDANGNVGEMVDPNGVRTVFTYDALSRMKTFTVKHPSDPALDALTVLDYDIEGRVTGIVAPDTVRLTLDYDLAGRLLSARSDDGERMDYQYDAIGNVLNETVKRANGSTSRQIVRTFDELGRLMSELLGPGRVTRWAYDKNSNPVQTTSPRGNQSMQAFDGLDRIVSVTAPAAGVSTTEYGRREEPISFTDARSVKTEFVRNGFGEVVEEISPDRGTSTYRYDTAGDLIDMTDGRGQQITYARDIMGRILTKTPVGVQGQTISYAWDVPGITGSFGIGRLARVTDASGITKFSYDHRGNMVTQQQKLVGTPDFVSLRYGYDKSDRIERITYPSGRQVLYVRDVKGRVSAVRTRASASVAAWTTVASGLRYEPFGPLLSMNLGNGLRAVNDNLLSFESLQRIEAVSGDKWFPFSSRPPIPQPRELD